MTDQQKESQILLQYASPSRRDIKRRGRRILIKSFFGGIGATLIVETLWMVPEWFGYFGVVTGNVVIATSILSGSLTIVFWPKAPPERIPLALVHLLVSYPVMMFYVMLLMALSGGPH
jgi:hypothetical protein